MRILFLRHADAEPLRSRGDAARELTAKGLKQADAVARAIRALGESPDAIIASPLTRAVQTARAIADEFPQADLQCDDLLAPSHGLDPDAVVTRLMALRRAKMQCAVMVGHAPLLDECLARLLAGRDDVGISMPKAGLACLHWPAGRSATGAELRWLMRPNQLQLIAEAER